MIICVDFNDDFADIISFVFNQHFFNYSRIQCSCQTLITFLMIFIVTFQLAKHCNTISDHSA